MNVVETPGRERAEPGASPLAAGSDSLMRAGSAERPPLEGLSDLARIEPGDAARFLAAGEAAGGTKCSPAPPPDGGISRLRELKQQFRPVEMHAIYSARDR